MLNDHLKLMSVFAAAGEITGRKKLQKMIYIAKKMDFPFQEKFEFHFYGPYSEELTLRVEELCNFGFLEERKEDRGSYCQYHYKVTESGREFLESAPVDIPRLRDCLKSMNGKNARFLELVSTVLYFEEEAKETVIEKVRLLKADQNYTLDEIEEAYQYIGEVQKTAVAQ